MTPRIGSLCSGYGGLDMAVTAVLGGRVAWVADPDPGAAAILAHHHLGVPNLGDITRIDWTTVEPVDILTAGFPCQDISNAGRRAGIEKGTRSGIWSHVVDAIRILRPGRVFLENVSALLVRGLDRVHADLAEIGYDTAWTCLRASDVGAGHRRDRLFILAWPAADAPSTRREGARPEPPRSRLERSRRPPTDAQGDGRGEGRPEPARQLRRFDVAECGGADRWGRYGPAIARWEHVIGRPAPAATEPGRNGPRLSARFVEWLMGLPAGWVTDVPGISRTAQLKALGNGVVPQQGAAAVRLLLPANPWREPEPFAGAVQPSLFEAVTV